jgi:hypothetical protein
LFEDSRSNLWVGTDHRRRGAHYQGRVEPLKIGRGQRAGASGFDLRGSTGAVWLLTEDGQLGRYANGQIDVWNMNTGIGTIGHRGQGRKGLDRGGNKILGLDPAACPIRGAACR